MRLLIISDIHGNWPALQSSDEVRASLGWHRLPEVIRDLKPCTDEETARQLGEVLRTGGRFKLSKP